MAKKTIYAVYKDDKFIDLGTNTELAERMCVRPDYIIYLASPANMRRMENRKRKNTGKLIAIRIGKEGDRL